MSEAEEATNKYHDHLDKCPQCEQHPFDQCPQGVRLMQAFANAMGRKESNEES